MSYHKRNISSVMVARVSYRSRDPHGASMLPYVGMRRSYAPGMVVLVCPADQGQRSKQRNRSVAEHPCAGVRCKRLIMCRGPSGEARTGPLGTFCSGHNVGAGLF